MVGACAYRKRLRHWSIDRVLALGVSVPAAQPGDAPGDLGRLARNPPRTTQPPRRNASGERDMRSPVAGQRIRHRTGLQMRQAESMDVPVHCKQLSRRHDQSRQNYLAPTEQQRRTDHTRQREPVNQPPEQPVDIGINPLGNRHRRVRPTGRRLTRNSCLAQSIPDLPDRGLGVRVEDQLDGVHHQPTRLVTHCASNAAALTDWNSAALIPPAPAGNTARTAAIRPSASRLPTSATLGSRGQAPITSPAHGIRWAASASSVNAVWFSVPSPGETTTNAGAPRSHARSRSAPPRAPNSTSSPPAPSTRVSFASTDATDPTNSSRVGSAIPARWAAAAGAGGSGEPHEPYNAFTPDSRATSARSSSRGLPVCTGLHTATSTPASRALHASAAVATVLPTPVSVPVTTRTLTTALR